MSPRWVDNATKGNCMEDKDMWRWINPEKQRYYQAELMTDLFGEWTVVYAWGGLGTARRTQRIKGLSSKEEGLHQITALDAVRRKRGYLPVETFADWRTRVLRSRKGLIANTQHNARLGDGLSQELDFG